MKSFAVWPCLVVLIVGLAVDRASWAQGFSVQDGYGFGLGAGYSSAYGIPGGRCGPGHWNGFAPFGGVIISPPREDLPYFAKFPPVYYSGIVPRPYGISPYAAPPGIVPVEMTVMPPPKPAVIKNPFYFPAAEDGELEAGKPVEVEAPPAEAAEQKEPRPRRKKKDAVTSSYRVVNPFYGAPILAAD